MSPPHVVVVGSVNCDFVVRGSRLPAAGETVTGGVFLRADGGKGANQAVAAARLGARVTLVARVGDDEIGRAAVAGLQSEGIDVRHTTVDSDRPSGVALIMVDERGENAISVAPGANAGLSPESVETARSAIEAADALLVQLETPLESVERAVRLAARAGAIIVLNPAPARELHPSLLELVDVLTPNRGEAETLTNEPDPPLAARALRRRGVGTVIVTLGGAGALLVADGGSRTIPGFEVRAVDTTAAGDAFNGCLAVALAGGEDPDTAVRKACAAGALAATVRGARPSLPDVESLHRFLAGRGP